MQEDTGWHAPTRSDCTVILPLDLASGYWQVEVAPEDREKTAFCTQDGLFEFHNTGTQQGKDKSKINMDAISATECIRGRKERGVV